MCNPFFFYWLSCAAPISVAICGARGLTLNWEVMKCCCWLLLSNRNIESPAREVDIMVVIMIMSLQSLSSYILLLRNGYFLQLKSWLQIVKQETRRQCRYCIIKSQQMEEPILQEDSSVYVCARFWTQNFSLAIGHKIKNILVRQKKPNLPNSCIKVVLSRCKKAM